jgi:hypothetical protein
VSAEAKLCGFLVLLVLIFIAAYAAGSHLGPVTTGHVQQSHSRQTQMNMGASPAGARAQR